MALKLLSLSEVKQSITMHEAIDATERAFIQLAQQEATLPLRTGIPVGKNGLTLTMPAYLSKEKILGLKVVSVFPDSVGLAIQDLGVGQVVYQNALKMNLGATFNLN